MHRYLSALVLAPTVAGTAPAAVKTMTIDYEHGGVQLQGFLAYDDAKPGPRPAVLIAHDWTGHNDYARRRAVQLAELGYVGFALDMYGKGVLLKDPRQASEKAGGFKKDRELTRQRMNAALAVVRRQPMVDAKRVAVMGYCFGGLCALELARSGADVVGCVSFHGDLSSPHPEDAKNIKCRVLALHGADDPHVPPDQVAAFEDEMRKAGVDWELVAYGGAVHSFTNPAVGTDKSRGNAYDAKADARSWVELKTFLADVFGQ
jgi:dienelactone hydrolase